MSDDPYRSLGRSMSERLRNVVTVIVIGVMAVTLVTLVVTGQSQPDRVQSIGERIKCPVCQGESIANSPSAMARDMMDVVAERVAAGETNDEIIDELLGSFSGAVLLDPPAAGSTLLLWLAPAIALMLGVVVIVWWRNHPTKEHPSPRPRARRLVPIALLAVALGTIVVVASSFLQDRAGPASGVAAIDTQDLDDVSNETMEAVIAANAGHPQVDGMRLALAERYFAANDYRSAFPHYLAVAQSPDATNTQAVTALVRLGWMAWDGNAEVETALELFDEALAIDEGSVTARYLKAQVLWCGVEDPDEAETLMQDILTDPDLPDDSEDLIRRDLETIRAGTACT